jgi:PAS domain S-box-containing protein
MAEQSATFDPAKSVPQQASILLVDANPTHQTALRSLLEDLGQNLVEARTGEEAIEQVKADEFAVILLAVEMPGVSGFETARAIRAQELCRHTPIIFLAASDISRAQMEEGYALGAVDILANPLMPIALQAKVSGFVQLFLDKQQTRQEADQLRMLVQGTTEYAIFMLDSQGRVVTWNAGAERLKGYRADEIIGQHFTRFYPQEALDRGWPAHELKVAAAEGRFEDEGWRVRKDGTQFWANVVITALRDENGELRGFSKVTRELTARREAEEFLRQSEERFRLLVETATDYAIFALDPDGHVASWNAGAERIKQYRADEIIGQHFSRFYPPEALDRGWPAHELEIAEEIGRFEDEGWRVRKDGTQFWANVVITALKNEYGELRGFSKITRDMTARKRAEENAQRLVEEAAARRAAEENAQLIRDQREWLRVTLTSIGDAVIATDTQGHVTLLNPIAEALTGWTQSDAAGQSLETVFVICNEQTRQTVENPVEKVLRDGIIVGMANHTVLIARDGTERPIDDSAAPIRDETGKMIGVVLVFRDVTEQRRAENELKASEARKSAILETALDCIITMDHNGKVVDFNSAAESTFGYSRSEIVGQELSEFIIPTSLRERYRQGMIRYLKTGEGPVLGHRHELRALRADGTETPVEVSITCSTVDGPPLFTAYLRDISERKRSEAVLAGQKRVLELLVQSEPLPDVLDALCEVMEGQSDDRLLATVLLVSDDGQRLRSVAGRRAPAEYIGAVDGIQIGPCAASCGTAAFRGEPVVVTDIATDPLWASSRELALRQGLRACWSTPILSSEGTVLGTFAVYYRTPRGPTDGERRLMDILTSTAGVAIERRRAESALRKSEQTARFLAEASAALSVIVDFDSTLQKVASLAVPSFADWATVDLAEGDGSLRRVAVAHSDPAKVELAHEVHRRFPPDPAAPQGVWNILRTGKGEIIPEISDELLVQSISDSELLGIMRRLGLKSYIGVPLKVRGRTLGVLTFIAAESGRRYADAHLATAQDLADRAAIAVENAQLYRELRDADQRKDEFLATLAHELRNPLAPIRNGLQVLRLAGAGGKMVDEARSMMERQLTQMVRLVDDLLDVSRITRNKLELRKERVTLAAAVHSAVETSRPLMEQAGHTFSLSLPPEPVYLDADLTRVAQVFSNLLNNAAKYTGQGGRISLAAELCGGEVVVRVRDNGLGIPSEALTRIFEMFSQVDRNMERAQGGLGIGLTLVRRLVEMHGGMVGVHSEGPGRGSEFVVRLPILQTDEPTPVSPHENLAATGKRRILIVDDNRDAATSLGMMLRLMGNETHTANDGLAAIEAAESFRPDLILLDIGLPKMNGYDACRVIRQQPWSNGMIIVALTGWGQEGDRLRSAQAGFDHHLVKPVELDTLAKLLANSVDRPFRAGPAELG